MRLRIAKADHGMLVGGCGAKVENNKTLSTKAHGAFAGPLRRVIAAHRQLPMPAERLLPGRMIELGCGLAVLLLPIIALGY
jgi:hypothetical protein